MRNINLVKTIKPSTKTSEKLKAGNLFRAMILGMAIFGASPQEVSAGKGDWACPWSQTVVPKQKFKAEECDCPEGTTQPKKENLCKDEQEKIYKFPEKPEVEIEEEETESESKIWEWIFKTLAGLGGMAVLYAYFFLLDEKLRHRLPQTYRAWSMGGIRENRRIARILFGDDWQEKVEMPTMEEIEEMKNMGDYNSLRTAFFGQLKLYGDLLERAEEQEIDVFDIDEEIEGDEYEEEQYEQALRSRRNAIRAIFATSVLLAVGGSGMLFHKKEKQSTFEQEICAENIEKNCYRDPATGNLLVMLNGKGKEYGAYKAAKRLEKEKLVVVRDAEGNIMRDIRGEKVRLRETAARMLEEADKMMWEEEKEHIIIREQLRTNRDQQKLKDSGIHANDPGTSYHETGLAVDVKNWVSAQEYLVRAGLIGGIFSGGPKMRLIDPNHFSYGEMRKDLEPGDIWKSLKNFEFSWAYVSNVFENIKRAGIYCKRLSDFYINNYQSGGNAAFRDSKDQIIEIIDSIPKPVAFMLDRQCNNCIANFKKKLKK